MGYGLLPLGVLFASIAHAWPTPQAAVDQYLQFELSGGRLQSRNYSMYLVQGCVEEISRLHRKINQLRADSPESAQALMQMLILHLLQKS